MIIIPIEIRRKDYGSFTITFFTYDRDNLVSGIDIKTFIDDNKRFKHITYTQIISTSLEDFNKSYILLQDNNVYNIFNNEYN